MDSAAIKKRRILGFLCLCITVGILIAGLWPFNFRPANKVEWIKNGKGIRFYGQGMVVSKEPFATRQTASGSGSITIELRIRSLTENTNGVPSILTLYNGDREQFIFGQWKSHLIIRVPAAKANNQKRYRELGVTNALRKDSTRLITVSSDKRATAVYLDGKLAKSLTGYTLVSDDQGFSGHLILGNSPEGTQSWNGSYFGLALYDRALKGDEALDHYHAWRRNGRPPAGDNTKPLALYVFDERGGERIRDHSGAGNHLLVPAVFQSVRRAFFGMPEKIQWFSRSNLLDVLINIFGFAPFGFLLAGWLRQAKNRSSLQVYGISIGLGFCLSFAIELIQGYLPMRDSSLFDVFSNTAGTAIGVLLFEYAFPYLRIKGVADFFRQER